MKRESRASWLATVSVVLCFAAAVVGTASAQIPQQITYQGRLSNNQNQPITGCLDMTFRLYDGPGGGATLLWTEAHLVAGTGCVQVTNGQFSVDLGANAPFNLTFDDQYFLGIQVALDNEMNPRKPFNSVGYALHAINAQDSDHSNNSDHANDSDHSNNSDNSNKANRSDFSVGIKEDRLAVVMVGLRGGDTPQPGSATSAIYGDPVTAMGDVASWCGTPSQSNTCMLKVMPGTYNIGASDLLMQQFVDIEGSGADVTIIQTTGTVHVFEHSQIRFLTIEKGTGGTPAVNLAGSTLTMSHVNISVLAATEAIVVSGFAPLIDHVTIGGCATSGITNEGGASPVITNTTINTTDCGGVGIVGIKNDNSSTPTLNNVRIYVSSSSNDVIGIQNFSSSDVKAINVEVFAESSASTAIGIDNDDSNLELVGSVVRGSSTTANSFGLRNVNAATADVDQSVLAGDQWAVQNQGGSARIGTTKLDGGAGGNGATYTCFGVYDGNYAALNTSCK